MLEDSWFPENEDHAEIENHYIELQQDLIDTASKESGEKPTKADFWEIAIREGLYQNLTEHPHVAIGYLLSTTHGPTNDYKEYLDFANNHSEVVILVAISALVNDTDNQTDDFLYDVFSTETDQALGNISDIDYSEKLDHVHRFQSEIDHDFPQLDLLIAKAARSEDNTGLYDRPLVDLLNTQESIQCLFQSEYYGYSTNGGDIQFDPTENACAYQLITNKRLLSAVGRKNAPDMVLSIPVSAIEEVEIHMGWTKDRIEVMTGSEGNDGPYSIWIHDIKENYTESEVLFALEN